MSRGRVVAIVVGLSFVAAAITGRAGIFVRPWFIPVLAGTGAVILAAAAAGRVSLSLPAAAVLLLPVVAGLGLSPQSVGRVSQGSGDTATLAARLGDARNPLLSGRDGAVTLLDIVVAESEVGGVALAGRRVVIVAVVAGPHRLNRSVMVCCAADARTIGVRAIGERLPPRQSWVRVEGVLTTQGTELVLEARRVRRIETPQEPFL
jgi:hypothetical protein